MRNPKTYRIIDNTQSVLIVKETGLSPDDMIRAICELRDWGESYRPTPEICFDKDYLYYAEVE